MQENTKKTLGIFWKYTMKYWPAFFITVFFLVVGAIITVITPIYLKKIVDLMSAGSLARNETYKNLMSILSVIVILYIVEWAWMDRFPPHRVSGKTKYSQWKNSFRYPKFGEIPKIKRTIQVEKGLVYLTKGVSDYLFNLG